MTTVLPPNTCTFCHTVHDPTRCQGHSTRGGDKRQCRSVPTTLMNNKGVRSDRCARHGGKHQAIEHYRPPADDAHLGALLTTAPNGGVMPNAAEMVFLNKLQPVPVDNPLEKLQYVAGLALAFLEVMTAKLEELRSIRYSTDGGEQIRGEIILFERAIDRANNILVGIARLNIDERLVRIAEGQRDMVLGAIEAALAHAGIVGPKAVEARAVAGRYLRVVGGDTVREIEAAPQEAA